MPALRVGVVVFGSVAVEAAETQASWAEPKRSHLCPSPAGDLGDLIR